mgnify:CR=1 FL=1
MKRRNWLALALAQSLIAMSTGFVGPMYAIYFEKVTGNLIDVGLIIGLFWVVVGILELFAGNIVDKIGKGKSFFIGGLLSSIAIISYPLARNSFELMLAEIVNAIGYSFHLPSFYALLAETTSKEKRGKEVSLIDAFWNVLYGISAIVSGMIIAMVGFSTIFGIAGIFNLLSSLLVGRRFNQV